MTKLKHIPKLNIKVEEEPKIIKLKDLKIPEGMRLLTFQEAIYIYDNDLLNNFPCSDWDLIQQFSKKNLEKDYKLAALNSYWNGDRLLVHGGGFDNDGGCASAEKFLSDALRFVGVKGDAAVRNRYVEFSEDFLALVFVDIHGMLFGFT